MKTLLDYFSDEQIILYLCKMRVKYAQSRNKKHGIHILTGQATHNYHINDKHKVSDFDRQILSELNELMPRRRQWRRLGERNRYKNNKHNSREKLNSSELAIKTIIYTIKYFKDKYPSEPFLQNLNRFIKEIQTTVSDPTYIITSPKIYPKPKDLKPAHRLKNDEKNVCRPIALFCLRDRLIIGFTNKFLTNTFDKYFEDSSLAFRAAQEDNGIKKMLSHHDAVTKILKYKEKHISNHLWVAECDMKKFYDSVSHDVALNHFDRLAHLALADNNQLNLTDARSIFIKYLESYCFKRNVLCCNTDENYWVEHKIASGAFDWIEPDLVNKKYYYHGLTKPFMWQWLTQWLESIVCLCVKRPSFRKARIGVPQGGALSGLIANMVLDNVDKQLNLSDDFFYVRFCDDMILMHPDQVECKRKIILYKSLLEELKLIPHKFAEPNELRAPDGSFKPFWKQKSKGPYKWDKVSNEGFPWLGFVGYEIHYSGAEVRVRKSSLKKELHKQKRVTEYIQKAIVNGKRVTNSEVAKSVITRLIGMSVGRVELWNHQYIANEMCWKVGFHKLSNTTYTVKQIKSLDRNRNKLYFNLINKLKKVKDIPKPIKLNGPKNGVEIISYNKPFSYFHQVISRKQL